MFSTRIAISEIQQGTDSFKLSVSPQDLEIEFRDVSFEEPIDVLIKTYRSGLEITLNVDLETVIGLVCSRCLDKFDFDFESTFELHLKAQKGGKREVDFSEEDFAFIDKDMGIIDLEERIRDELILELPRIPLCREACPGIEYGAIEETIDPRWEALEKLKQDKEVENGSSKEKK